MNNSNESNRLIITKISMENFKSYAGTRVLLN